VTFLTRIPLANLALFSGDDVARASPWFPIIGAGIGAVVGALATELAGTFSSLVASVLAVGAGVLLTGAMHLDGLGDTFDGLGARSRDRALEVMRESTMGAYGVIAIVLDLLVRVSVVNVLVIHHDALVVAVIAGTLSRTSPVVLAALLPYARTSEGLGRPLTHAGRLRSIAAVVIGLGVAVALRVSIGTWASLMVLALTMVMAWFYRRWLGGFTGDLLGAASEVNEVAVLLLGVAMLGHV
jgi:adenosylcobinamide-GDP ribazoletransferase